MNYKYQITSQKHFYFTLILWETFIRYDTYRQHVWMCATLPSPTTDAFLTTLLVCCSLYTRVLLQTREATPLMFTGIPGSKIFTM
jgi:hypothetical protein